MFSGQSYKIKALLVFLLLIGLAVVYAFEFRHFNNTFGVSSLVWQSLLVGVITGIFVRWRLKDLGSDVTERMFIWTACVVLLPLYFPLFGSLSNRLLSPHDTEQQSFEFFKETPYASSRFGFVAGEKIEPEGYYIFIARQGKIERLKSDIPRFNGVLRGDMVEVPVKKGLWGYEVVCWEKANSD